MINSSRLSFNRFEWAGSFGDVGTDLPLLIAMIGAAQLDVTSTFVMFGLFQILSGLYYGLPMPMQPLKAMAVIVIAQKVPSHMLFVAGFSIGVIMLILSLSGLLEKLKLLIPHHVIRGLQIGLAFSLIKISLINYIGMGNVLEISLALGAALIYFLIRNRLSFPGAFIFFLAGIIYALFVKRIDFNFLATPVFKLPIVQNLEWQDLLPACVVLVLPQLPLSLANSVIATQKTLEDFFPERLIGLKKIGLTYAFVNLISPFFSGIPLCHGCGGLAGHYGLGARTGGSVVIYGVFYLVVGLFFSQALTHVLAFFPTPLLGVILILEAITLLGLARDLKNHRELFGLALMVGVLCALVPQGFVVGLIFGVLLTWIRKRSSYNL